MPPDSLKPGPSSHLPQAAIGSGPLSHHRSIRHVIVYQKSGRFGGWPANHGIWLWGNEILVGFSAGYFKDHGPKHTRSITIARKSISWR